jgi:hypothetical protein
MKRPGPYRAAAAVLGVVLLVAASAGALHRATPLFLQLSEAPADLVGGMRFSDRSNLLLFHSDADLLGNGNATPQIFLFDLAGRVKRGQRSLYQLTFGEAPSLGPTAAHRGRVIAFDSEADLLGNGSTGRQIFASTAVKWSRGIVPLFQVTRAGAPSWGALLNARRGRTLIFSSHADLTDAGVPPGEHLYRVTLESLARTACPGYPCPDDGNPGLELIAWDVASQPDVDYKGDRAVFVSTGDVAGTGCANGASQIFLRDFKSGTVRQLTCGEADSRRPVFTQSYHAILFESDADLAGTGSTRTQIFQLDLRTSPPLLTQMTFGTDGDSTRPAPNGTKGKVRFFFHSTATLNAGGAPGTDRLYQFDEDRGFVRITTDQPIGQDVAGQFTFAAFASDADFVGNGNSETQLFVVNSYPLYEP